MQYNPFESEDHTVLSQSATDDRVDNASNGSIIAVSYEARAAGVKRIMRGREARKACPELQMVQVPTRHGKADLEIYRAAGAEVVNILMGGGVTERASVDEAYVDVTLEAAKRLKLARAAGAGALSALIERAAAASAGSGDPGPHISVPELDEREGDLFGEDENEGDEDELNSGANAAGSVACGASGGASSSASAVLPQLVSRDDVRQGHSGQGAQPTERSASTLRWWGRPIQESTPKGTQRDDGGAGCWQEHELLLAAGSLVVAELRAAVRNNLGYSCSAGVAHNKILAKLGCGLHKPNQQTLVPLSATAALLAPLDLTRLRGLGAKLGDRVKKELGCNTVGELASVPVARLIDVFGATTATQLGMLARGEDTDEVKNRALPKSIGCGKVFNRSSWKTGANSPLKSSAQHQGSSQEQTPVPSGSGGSGAATVGPRVWLLRGTHEVETWVRQLANEQAERLAKDRAQHSRVARSLTVSVSMEYEPRVVDAGQRQQQPPPQQQPQHKRVSMSKSARLRYGATEIFEDAMSIMRRWLQDHRDFGVSSLYLTGTDFAKVGGADISKYLRKAVAPAAVVSSPTSGGDDGGAREERDTKRQRLLVDDAVLGNEAQLAASVQFGAEEEDILAEDDDALDDAMNIASASSDNVGHQNEEGVNGSAPLHASIQATRSPLRNGRLAQAPQTEAGGVTAAEVAATHSPSPWSSPSSGAERAATVLESTTELSVEQLREGADIDTRRYLEANTRDLDVATFFALPETLRIELVRDWKRATAPRHPRANGAAKGTRKISSFFSKR